MIEEEIISAYEAGESLEGLCTAYRLSPVQIVLLLHRHGVAIRTGHFYKAKTDQQYERVLLRYYTSETPLTELCREGGFTSRAFRSWLEHRGLPKRQDAAKIGSPFIRDVLAAWERYNG